MQDGAIRKKFADIEKRFAKVKTWKKRLKKLNNRVKDPLSDHDFCLKYDIAEPWFNREKNGKNVGIPRESSVDKVEKALAKERV
jgi:hypothetical protein